MQDWRWLLLTMLFLLVTACDGDRSQNLTARGSPPASRIITLSPHLTELVFSAGAGNQLVGVVDFSDFPPAALGLPHVGDAFRLDYEAIVGLDPDLILAWGSGTPQEVVARLRQLGYQVVALEERSLAEIADSLRLIGRLAGTQKFAEAAASTFESSLDDIRTDVAGRSSVTVFFQVSARPLFTISRRHVIGEAIELCGGNNIFGDLVELSPSISPEAVIDAAPEAIIAGRYTSEDITAANQLEIWQQWVSIPAVRDGNLYFVDANLLNRSTVRILDGVRDLCQKISMAREN